MRVTATLIAIVFAMPAAVAAGGQITYFKVHSPVGESMGQGNDYYLTPAGSLWRVQENAHNGVSVSAGEWRLDVAAPNDSALHVGQYLGASEYPNGVPSVPRMAAIYQLGFCTNLLGSFEIRDVSIGPTGTVERFWATFVQSCDGGSTYLTGEIVWNEEESMPSRGSSWSRLKIRYR